MKKMYVHNLDDTLLLRHIPKI